MPPADPPEAFIPADPSGTDRQAGADGSADGKADAAALRWSCSAPPQGGIPRPFLDWLAANDIDGHSVPEWPLIHFDCPEPGMMRIESFWKIPGQDHHGQRRIQPTVFWQDVGMMMRTVPMPVPMSEQLRAVWDHMASQARAARDIKHLISALGQGATVLTVDETDRVILVMNGAVSDHDAERLVTHVGQVFPNIKVSLLTGVSGVMVTGLDGEHHHEPGRLQPY